MTMTKTFPAPTTTEEVEATLQEATSPTEATEAETEVVRTIEDTDDQACHLE